MKISLAFLKMICGAPIYWGRTEEDSSAVNATATSSKA